MLCKRCDIEFIFQNRFGDSLSANRSRSPRGEANKKVDILNFFISSRSSPSAIKISGPNH
jgi:hypothetical protein